MTYEAFGIDQIFQHLHYRNDASQAMHWVEAENDMKVREIICKWFNLLEAGTANDIDPDPFNTNITQDRADKLVEEMDADFMIEAGRFKSLNKEVGPEFSRLTPSARIAMAQDIWSVLKTDREIELETYKRLKAGEELPPKQHCYSNDTYEDLVLNQVE